MWIIINCILLMLGAVVLALGISFFIGNYGNRTQITSIYILMYSITSAIWCLAYGFIGITGNFELAAIIRRFGVFAIDAFFITEVFLVSRMCKAKRSVVRLIRALVLILSTIDFITFSRDGIDLFARFGNWTTWYSNPEMDLYRDIHSAFIVLVFITALITGLVWIKNDKLKRRRKFMSMVFIANFILLFFAIPDTLLPILNMYAIPTSGIGAAGCTLVMWYAAARLNSFEIQLGNIVNNMFDFIDAGVVVFDTNQSIAMANPYAENIIDRGDAVGCRMDDLFKVSVGEIKEMFDHSLNAIYNMNRKGRDDRTYSIRMNAVKDDYGDPYCFLCVFIDVTKEIGLIQKLEVANNAKTDFLTSMSHEIRTPITAIMGFNAMIARESSDSGVKTYTGNIDIAAHHLLSIINDLLDMEQVASGKLTLSSNPYSLGKLLRDVYTMHDLKAREKGLEFTLSTDKGVPDTLYGDEVRIQQIIINLISNAIKYTSEGSVHLQADHRDTGDGLIDLIISVKDTGKGIREEDLPYLYDIFERFENDSNTHIEGTGVGLALTKGLVEIMQGTISVSSTYGEGTCFTVTIPQKVIEDELVEADADALTGEDEDNDFIAPDASILVVDDNEMNRKVVRGLLKPLQAEVDTADGGEEMLELIRENHYDIIFLDHLMPIMDGIDALTRMKEDKDHLNQTTPVIVMTANAIRGMKAKYLESGFSDYIGKPIDPDILFDMVRNYLDKDLIKKAEKKTEEGVGNILPPIDGIDWNMALTTATNIRMVRDLVKTFCDTAKRELADLNEYYDKCAMGNDEEALKLYRVKVHAMKNSAALVGASELSKMAKNLEGAADRKDLIFIRDHHAAFAGEYKRIAQVLQREVVGTDEEKVMSNEELLDNIGLAEQALNNYDTLTLNELMLTLGSTSFSRDEIEELVISLQEAVRDFDKDRFFEISEKIRDLVNE